MFKNHSSDESDALSSAKILLQSVMCPAEFWGIILWIILAGVGARQKDSLGVRVGEINYVSSIGGAAEDRRGQWPMLRETSRSLFH